MRERRQPSSHSQLLAKYRELCRKHESLLERLAQQSSRRLVVARIAAWTVQSKELALALSQGGEIASTNPAWRELERAAPAGWLAGGERHPDLGHVVLATCERLYEVASVRVLPVGCDGVLDVVLERITAADEEAFIAFARWDREARRQHDHRNDLAAIALQLRMLREQRVSGAVAKRLDAIDTVLARLLARSPAPHL